MIQYQKGLLFISIIMFAVAIVLLSTCLGCSSPTSTATTDGRPVVTTILWNIGTSNVRVYTRESMIDEMPPQWVDTLRVAHVGDTLWAKWIGRSGASTLIVTGDTTWVLR